MSESLFSIQGEETRCLDQNYVPDTVNTDGWPATQNAWKRLFPSVLLVKCFLHLYISIRNRTKKKFKDAFQIATPKLWNCYNAKKNIDK